MGTRGPSGPWPSPTLLQLRRQLQPPQGVVPHVFEHAADGAERVAPGAIEALLPIGAGFDQASLQQRAQLERDRAKRYVQR
jgi:hypothetical protein